MHIATSFDLVQIVQLLLESNVVDVDARDSDGRLAVRLLLREGADIGATMEEMTSRNWRQERRTGRTALHLAVAGQHQEAI